jgi:hypothetical protein
VHYGMKRLLWLIPVLLIVGAMGWILLEKKSTAPPTPSSNTITASQEAHVDPAAPRIRAVSGTAFVQRNNTVYTAVVGFPLQQEDVITTGPTSTVDILWPNYGHTLLGMSAVTRIMDATQDTSRFSAKLSMTSGRLWTRLQKLLETDDVFGVQFGNAVLTVRGTSFGIGLFPARALVQVTESNVALAAVAADDADPFASKPNSVKIGQGQEMEIPFMHGVAVRGIPTVPRELSDDALSDPFLTSGDESVPDAELTAPTVSMPEPSVSRTLDVIQTDGRLFPLAAFHVGEGSECDGPHYHANNGSALSLDGTVIPDLGGCGFGRVPDHPTIRLEVR